MNLLKVIKNVLIRPINFFENLKKQKGIKIAFVYLMILALISILLKQTLGRLFQSYSYGMFSKIYGFALPQPQYALGTLIIMGVIGYVFAILFSFVVAGILHVWILLFGGTGDYTKTYQLYVYSLTPKFLIGWTPFLGLFAWLYYIILLIIGTQKLHNISKKKSILMYLIPVVFLIIIYLVILFFSITVFKSAGPNIFKNLT